MSLILVTGATGFLGARIAQQLADAGCHLRTTSRSRVADSRNEHIVADLTRDALAPLVRNCDVVIHAAGLAHQFRPSPSLATDLTNHNAVATRRLAQAATEAGAQRFVLVSSVSVYGSMQGRRVDETTPCLPRGDYARSKRQAEEQLLELCRHAPLRSTILRLATLYGEHDRGNVARLMSAIDRGRFVWIGTGANRKSLLHVDDAARACALAARCDPLPITDMHPIFNVAAEPVSMRQIVETLAAALKRPLPRLRVPVWPARVALSAGMRLPLAHDRAARLHQTLHKWLADDAYCGRRFAQAYGFQPQVDLASGLTRQVAAYRSPLPRTPDIRQAA